MLSILGGWEFKVTELYALKKLIINMILLYLFYDCPIGTYSVHNGLAFTSLLLFIIFIKETILNM